MTTETTDGKTLTLVNKTMSWRTQSNIIPKHKIVWYACEGCGWTDEHARKTGERIQQPNKA